MNWLRRERREAIERLRTWVFPSAIRVYRPTGTRGGARVYRYPSPGSEPHMTEDAEIDYKVAYRDSQHHIRNFVDTHLSFNASVLLADPFGDTVEEKLIRLGLLSKSDAKDTGAVEKARQAYQDRFGESVDVKVYRDDFELTTGMEDKDSREFINEYVSGMFEGVKQVNYQEGWLNDLDDIYRAQFYYLKSIDMAGDDPVYRQLLLDLEFQLDGIRDRRLEAKKFPVFKGKKSTWNILDDSFSNENIQKVQSSVGVYELDNHQETAPALQENVIPAEEEEPYSELPHGHKPADSEWK